MFCLVIPLTDLFPAQGEIREARNCLCGRFDGYKRWTSGLNADRVCMDLRTLERHGEKGDVRGFWRRQSKSDDHREHKRNFTELTRVREVVALARELCIQSPRQEVRNEEACVVYES